MQNRFPQPPTRPHGDIVKKNVQWVLIQTDHGGLIQGFAHLRPERRVVDELNLPTEPFFVVTEVTIYGHAGEVLTTAPFLIVQKASVVWVRPDEDAPPSSMRAG